MEHAAARWIYDLPAPFTPALEMSMQAGTRGAILLAVVAALLARQRRLAWQLALAGSSAWLVAWLLKRMIDRPRPTAATLARPVRDVVEGPGLPSTHTAIAAALATVLVAAGAGGRALATVAVALAALTALARVHLGVHWPLDVLAGGAIGLASGLAVARSGRARHRGRAGTRSGDVP